MIRDQFATEEFISDNRSLYDRYIELRVHGYPSHQAFLRVFGADYWEGPQQGYQRLEAMEGTSYYQDQFKKLLKSIQVSELWDVKKAINALLETYRNPMERGSTRLNAQKELNIMCGIVVIDENGKTRAGKSLDDFYAQVLQSKKAESTKANVSSDKEEDGQVPNDPAFF